MTAEPVFVRKPGATAEDEGWVLSYVYDPQRDLSDVVILDAQDFAGEPVATIRLPVRVPFGFHGGWAPIAHTLILLRALTVGHGTGDVGSVRRALLLDVSRATASDRRQLPTIGISPSIPHCVVEYVV